MPHRQADSNSLKILLGEAGAKRDECPNRHHVSQAINVIYDVVIQKLRAELHKASAFSLVFDGWTARGLRNAYIAILYSWIDENLNVIKMFVDAVFC